MTYSTQLKKECQQSFWLAQKRKSRVLSSKSYKERTVGTELDFDSILEGEITFTKKK